MASSPSSHRRALFGSAAWNTAWIAAWGDATHHSTAAGLFTTASRLKGIVSLRTSAPTGISLGKVRSIRSEYFFFAADPKASQDCIRDFLAAAAEQPWHQLFLPDIPRSSNELALLKDASAEQGWSFELKDESWAYGVQTHTGDFADYLTELGKHSRLQLFNRRKKLAEMGEVTISNLWPDIDGFLQLMDEFHQARWHKPAFSPRNRKFIQLLLPALAAGGHGVDLSVMTLDGKPLAAILDVHVEGHVYNLQSGFRGNFGHKISLGSLHFGYKIEQAFADPKLEYYDFMAGEGKNSDYKKQFATAACAFVSVALVRSPWLKYLYRISRLWRRRKMELPLGCAEIMFYFPWLVGL